MLYLFENLYLHLIYTIYSKVDVERIIFERRQYFIKLLSLTTNSSQVLNNLLIGIILFFTIKVKKYTHL